MSYDAPTFAYVLVEVAPNGAEKVAELFEADSLEAAEAYAAQVNTTGLDVFVQRFRIAGRFQRFRIAGRSQRFRIAGRFAVLSLFRSNNPEDADAPYYLGL